MRQTLFKCKLLIIIPINPGLYSQRIAYNLRGLLRAALALSGVGIIIQSSMQGLSSFCFYGHSSR